MLDSFRELADNYQVIFFDAYGVLKNFEGVMDGVLDVLADLKREGKELYVVTNDASRSPKKMSLTYVHPEHGEIFAEDRIISSGLLARDFLRAKVRGKKVGYLGKPDSAYYIQSAGLTAVPSTSATTTPTLARSPCSTTRASTGRATSTARSTSCAARPSRSWSPTPTPSTPCTKTTSPSRWAASPT